MPAMIGAGAVLAIAEETTEGTAVTVTEFAPLRSSSLNREIARDNPEPLVFGTDALPVQRDTFVVSDNAGGDLVKTLYYDGDVDMLLLKHAFGSVASSGSGPYVWTYTLTAATPVKPSLTIEIDHGQGGPSSSAEVFAGCRIARMELDVTQGQPAIVTFGVIAKTSGGLVSPTSPTFSAANIVTHNHLTSFVFNSTTLGELLSAKLTIDKKVERTPELGSLTTGIPQVAGVADIMLEVRHRWASNAQYAALLAGTAAAGTITITDGTRSLVLTFGRLQVQSVNKGVTGPGFIEVMTSFKVLGTSGNAGVIAALTNAVAP